MSDTFSGYELESGILQRARQWRDLLPILVLAHALRVAGSPLYVGLSLVAVLITDILAGIGGVALRPGGFAGPGGAGPFGLGPLSDGLAALTDTRWIAAFGWSELMGFLGIIALWSLPVATIARAGGCYAAQRDQSFLQNLVVAGRRLPWVWLIALMPVAGALALSGVMVAVGLLQRLGSLGAWLGEVAGLLALPVMVFAGLIAAGAVAAVPLAWAAMVIEKRADSFDALSRGYEYLYRRPVQLIVYGVGGYLLTLIAYWLARAVSSAALVLGTLAAGLGSGNASPPASFQWVIAALPVAVALSTLWGMVGAIYLLMRQSANGQEIEDIAVSPIDRRPAEMPTLHPEAAAAHGGD